MLLYTVRFTRPGSKRVESVELEARGEHDALERFHKGHGAEPRVLDIKESV